VPELATVDGNGFGRVAVLRVRESQVQLRALLGRRGVEADAAVHIDVSAGHLVQTATSIWFSRF
jgi:hypothetical protein